MVQLMSIRGKPSFDVRLICGRGGHCLSGKKGIGKWEKSKPPANGRPCRAEIRWYGGTDAGLKDVRNNVRLWGLKSEIERHRTLWSMEEHKHKSATEISELILGERLNLAKRKEMYQKLRGTEYDGIN